jgi:pyrimidine operon attenuation protein / uracil phosphoribosyltransferase
MGNKKYIFNKEVAAQKLNRLALEIAEHLQGDGAELIIIGIKESGIVIAGKIGLLVQNYLPNQVTIISAELNKDHPSEVTLSQSIDFTDKNVIVVDDVANSGKTLLYVMQPLLQYHPKRIQVLVLVERMHKLFPVKPDYVGLSLATTLQDFIKVEVKDGEIEGAYIN